MADKAKLREILAILSPDGTDADFKSFDEGVDKLKKGLKEKIQVKTLDDVNGQLRRFKESLDFEPVLTALKDIDKNFDSRIKEVASALAEEVSRFDELSKSEREETGSKVAESQGTVESLRIELETLKTQKEKETNYVIEALKGIPALRADSESSFNEIKTRLDALEVEQPEVDLVSPIKKEIESVRTDLISRIKENHGDHANRNIAVGSNTSVLSRYTDINIIAGSNITLGYTPNDTTKYLDLTIAASGGSGSVIANAAGQNTQVQFNDASVFGATDGLTFNKNTSVLTSSILSVSTEQITVPAASAVRGLDMTNASQMNGIRITATSSIAASRSIGGELLVSNGTVNTGNAAVFYSNVASALGRIVHITADNVSFNKEALYVESDSNSTTTLGVHGNNNTQGVIKVEHVDPGSGADGNAAALSIDLQGASTAAQGIFIDATTGGTTGNLLELRNSGATKLRLSSTGVLTLNNAYAFPTADGATNTVLTTNGAGQLAFASVATGGGTGITRTPSIITANTAGASVALTDYIYIATAGLAFTLPTAVNNKNLYTLKNASSSSVLITAVGGNTIDGSGSVLSAINNQALDFISDNSNWRIV